MFTSSIVTYGNDPHEVDKVISSVTSLKGQIFIVDNYLTSTKKFVENRRFGVEYIHNPSNPGFGAAHNIAIKKAIELGAKYHFIINPDIEMVEDVFTPMVEYMENNPDVGMMMPKILNEDGSFQYLPKLLPSPLWIFRRKLKRLDPWAKQFVRMYELRNMQSDQIYNVPILSGCFTLLRLDAIKEVGMYDEDFFMYFEDFDLSRRMHAKYKTIYFPQVSVIHGYEGGANKSWRLFKIFIKSMITYFNKWGWFFDKERKRLNEETQVQFK